MSLRREDHVVEVDKLVTTSDGTPVRVVRIDFQTKSVVLLGYGKIGFVKARKMGIEPQEVV